MDQVLERCGTRNLSLNATCAAYNLYVSMGFTPEATVHQCQGAAASRLSSPGVVNGELKTVLETDFDNVTALDAGAFGTNRTELLRLLGSNSNTYAIWRDGTLMAYAFRRRLGRGQVIGPIVARSDDDAIALVSAHLMELPGQFARVDTRQSGGAFITFPQESGFRIFDTVTTMSRANLS